MTKKSKIPARKSMKAAPKRRREGDKRAAKDVAKALPPKAEATKPRDPRLPAPGTTVTRVFNGKTLTLKALADGGFEFDGQRFGSVSGAAKKACGATTVDGYAWWGLNPDSRTPRERDSRLPAAGETIVREWRGTTLKVLVEEDGFVLDGKRYGSLSAAASAATGYGSVNGFLFFGLTSRPAASGVPATELKGSRTAKASAPKIGGESNDIATAAGQRAALAAAGVTKSEGKSATKARPTAKAK